MIATRPDWCISRQRVWGVPIIVFYCEVRRAAHRPQDPRRVVRQFAEHTADVWYTHAPPNCCPPDALAPSAAAREFRKENDILDVWFDSGSSHLAVLNER